MIILFPKDPLRPDDPDEAFQREWDAARAVGLRTGLVDIDVPSYPALCKRTVRETYKGELMVYRGWMLTVSQYAVLYEMAWDLGYRMINTPNEYGYCHELPRWYSDFEGTTPKSLWFPNEPFDHKEYVQPGTGTLARIEREVPEKLGPGPYIVKDFVKSRKHEWADACFIEGSHDIRRVAGNFVERQADDLVGGLVFRKYERFRHVGEHPKSKIPIFNEVRVFGARGHELTTFPYWGAEEGGSGIMEPKQGLVPSLLAKVKSNFFTIDLALLPESYGPYTGSESWIIVELGDGQVAGLPEHVDAKHFYGELMRRFSPAP